MLELSEVEDLIHVRTGVRVLLGPDRGFVAVHSIRTPAERRRQGLGTSAMTILCREADTRGWMLSLVPDDCFGTPELILRAWYHRFGFRGEADMVRPVFTPT